jgi:hypothetical protein
LITCCVPSGDLSCPAPGPSYPSGGRVLRWRADRLQRALGRHAGEQGTPDPVLVAARNAAAVASLLITYREASELWAAANSSEELQDVPGETLGLAAALLTQIGETIRDIAS